MREIKLRYTFQHDETGRIASVIKNLDDEGPYLDHPSNKWTLLGRDQYIGIKDKNNKEIYEGHIIKHNENIFKVKWSRNRLGWVLRTSKGMNWRDGKWMHNVRKYIEIIGDIYENPDYLRK